MLFPPAQRPYILFLHAADSHRLNRSLLRSSHPTLCTCRDSYMVLHVPSLVPRTWIDTASVMTWCLSMCSVLAVRLRELNGELLSGGAALWRAQAEQHLLQTTALARFLSYLAFAFAEGNRDRTRAVAPT